MNDDVEITPEERLHDLARAYVHLREGSGGIADPQKAAALAQLSIAMSLLEREYAEGEYEESGEDEEDEEDDDF
ncbi:MAG TPA: hypothetical protein VKT72_11325 [Candidatus Baltobacteraceae bacterium]|nr:hypothetical protein [Candidatus Baltobacteraceae bacterium]